MDSLADTHFLKYESHCFFPHLEQACLKLNFNRDAAESSFVVSREKKRN
jgi:hypothetical protein